MRAALVLVLVFACGADRIPADTVCGQVAIDICARRNACVTSPTFDEGSCVAAETAACCAARDCLRDDISADLVDACMDAMEGELCVDVLLGQSFFAPAECGWLYL